MTRLQIMRMPSSLKLRLGQLSLVLLTAACGGGAAAPAGDVQPPAAGDATAQPATSSSTKTAASDTSTTAAGQTKAAAPASTAAGAAAPASSMAAADTAKAPASTASMTTAAAAGSSAATGDVPSSSGSAGSADAPAAGSGAEAMGSAAAAGASGGAAGEGAPMSMLTEDGIDPLMPDWSKRTDLGEGDGSDVVTIGDSWMDYIGGGGGIQAGLDRAGHRYRHYALSATTLLSGQIPGQYTQAKAVNPDIKTVIMTGGGNDVMFSGGCNTEELCEMSVMRIQEALQELWSEMADDGVKDVIYIQYSADAGTAPQGTRPKTTKPVPICLTGRILCHSVPTTEIVMGQLVDGIHPTAGANDRIAAELIKIMAERKMRR